MHRWPGAADDRHCTNYKLIAGIAIMRNRDWHPRCSDASMAGPRCGESLGFGNIRGLFLPFSVFTPRTPRFALAIWIRFHAPAARRRCGSSDCAALHSLGLWLRVCLSSSGCAMLRRRGPSADEIAAARELSRQGVAAMESGKWQQAENLLKKSLDTSPDDAATRRSLAEALWHRGAEQEAIDANRRGGCSSMKATQVWRCERAKCRSRSGRTMPHWPMPNGRFVPIRSSRRLGTARPVFSAIESARSRARRSAACAWSLRRIVRTCCSMSR